MSDQQLDPQQETVEISPDAELLLLSWTQMVAIELIAPEEEALAAKADLAATLQSHFSITDIQLKERTFAHYEVSFREHNKERVIRFEIDEVESIYDL